MLKKIGAVIIVIIVMGVGYNLLRQMVDALQSGKRLDEAAERLVSLQRRNLELKKRLAEVSSINFIEDQARNKLNLSRAGETVMVIPKSEIERVLGLNKKLPEIKLPNWQGWLKLLWRDPI